AGAGLVRPELAVLLAYAKSDLVASILGSSLPEDPSLAELANGYFPARVGQAFADLVGRHRLYRELVATALAGTIVDQMGIKWAHEASAEAGRPLAEVVACWWTAWQVLGGARMLAVLEEAAPSLSADTEAELHAGLAGAVVAVARAYLVETPAPGGVGGQAVLGPSARIAADRPVVAALADGAVADGAVVGTAGPGAGAGTGPGAALEAAIGRWLGGVGVVDVGVVSRAGGRSVAEAVAALEAVDSLAGCPALAGALGSVPPTVRWARWLALSLLDDLAGWRRGVAVAALRATPGRPAADAVASWLAPHSPALARGRAFVDELAAGQAGGGSGGSGPRILTSLSLASLAVRSLCGPAGSDGAAGRSPVPGVLDDRWPGGRAPEGRWGA
ncbi:MAG: hypothetical protein ACRDY0_02565, partial [Acidimicrobiales bacterium]